MSRFTKLPFNLATQQLMCLLKLACNTRVFLFNSLSECTLTRFLCVLLAAVLCSHCAVNNSTPPPLIGQWESIYNPKILVEFRQDGQCLFTLQKLTSSITDKRCKYIKPAQSDHIEVYFEDAQGNCSGSPDLEFVLDEAMPALELLMPPGNIELRKVIQNSN